MRRLKNSTMDVSNILADKKDDPVVLNFAQNQEFTGNFLVGTLLPPEKLPEDVAKNPWPKQKNGVSKEVVYWEPNDAVTRDRNDQMQETPILTDNLIKIGPGVVSPRKVYILMPDNFAEVPDEFLQPTNSANPEIIEKLGIVIAQFFRHSKESRALKKILENDELNSKIEELMKNDVIDDALLQKRIREHERMKDAADPSGKSDSEN
jgi:hypothetical protein